MCGTRALRARRRGYAARALIHITEISILKRHISFGQRNLDRQKLEIEFPENGAPTELVVKDLIEGHGA